MNLRGTGSSPITQFPEAPVPRRMMNRDRVLPRSRAALVRHVHPQQSRRPLLLRPVRRFPAQEAQQLHAASLQSQSVQKIRLAGARRARPSALIVGVLVESLRSPQFEPSSAPVPSPLARLFGIFPQHHFPSPLRVHLLGVARTGFFRSSRDSLQFPETFGLPEASGTRGTGRFRLRACVRVHVRQLAMQIDDLTAKLLVLLVQLGEDAVALLRVRTDARLGRRLKPLSPPPDLVLAAARRILFLRQRLQPSPAQEAAQRTETTAAAQQLIHAQLRQ